MRAAGMGFGGDWQQSKLLHFLQNEAKELDLAIEAVEKEQSSCCCEDKREHGKLLHEEHMRLARQRETKEQQMNMLRSSKIKPPLQQVAL